MSKRKRSSSILRLILPLIIVSSYTIVKDGFNTKTSLAKTSVPTEEAEAKLSNSPEYYKVIGPAKIDAKVTGIGYSYDNANDKPLSVKAKITSEIFEKEKSEKREPIKVDPAGWGHNRRVVIPSTIGSIKDYKGYFWNRSHLLADSLGGEPTKQNLITGTRCQNGGLRNNQGGMAYCENKARKYLNTHKNSYIYYYVTCKYTNNEVIPRKVVVDMLSEDGSINERVEVLNYAYKYKINYNTGEFEKID